ncbi:abortive infection family protein [Stenotrophomonas bentonitica]|uniref:abortive infection family protein n=1 Tax=Stenotrophomonas bentonitica TaxID=1450134 RepID=UPI000C9CE5EA|nr:abortive infection family protein [Stenotrophomonas bentonitica]
MESSELEEVLATVHSLLLAEDFQDAAALVRACSSRAELTGYDNWNGGTNLWDIHFQLPAIEFARLGSRRGMLEEQISTKMKDVMGEEPGNWYTAKIVPARETGKGWRTIGSKLPRQVRQNIFDGLRLDDTSWKGRLDDVEFLSRLYDLGSLPSTDPRYATASDDIWQHCINNDDWERDWVFTDGRFNLLDGPPDKFLRFLCEIVHPIVRPDRNESLTIVSHINDQLRGAGWEIFEEERIGGRSRYASRELVHHGQRAVSRGRTVADALDAGWMAKEIERLEKSIDGDPASAIGTAKELVETCCKTILNKRGVVYGKAADIGDLTKLLLVNLQLVPEAVSDEKKGADNIRLILRNLTSLTHNLAQLRGLYGTGHGRDGKHRGLQPRHARLAVASAVAFIDFVSDTYRNREESNA